MENATKALIIVAGVLIGIMILSLGVALFGSMQNYVQQTNDKIEINAQNAFNTQFLNYDRDDLTIQDIISVTNLAQQNNVSHNVTLDASSRFDPSVYYVTILLDDGTHGERAIESDIQDTMEEFLRNHIEDKFECTEVQMSEITGRVFVMTFEKK